MIVMIGIVLVSLIITVEANPLFSMWSKKVHREESVQNQMNVSFANRFQKKKKKKKDRGDPNLTI
jgi:hypothetical protein